MGFTHTFRIPGRAFTLLLKFLRSLRFLVGGEKGGVRRRGCAPSLQSSLHGSARPSGSPSRHHQAMTPGSFPIKALAQGLAPDECGHIKGRTPPQVPWESRQPRPVGRKASFLTSHPNPSSNFPQFLSTMPSAAIPVASPPLSRVLEHKRGLFKVSLPSHQNSPISPRYLGFLSTLPHKLICFFPQGIILVPHSPLISQLPARASLHSSRLSLLFPPHLLSPRNPSLHPAGPRALRLFGPPHLFLYLVPVPLSPYGPRNPPPYPLSAPSRPQPTLPERPLPSARTPSAL